MGSSGAGGNPWVPDGGRVSRGRTGVPLGVPEFPLGSPKVLVPASDGLGWGRDTSSKEGITKPRGSRDSVLCRQLGRTPVESTGRGSTPKG